MSITADQERAYYDNVYGRYLNVPDSQLICTRATLTADLDNPKKAIWERRRLHQLVMKRLLAEPVRGRRVLDYGCGTGDWGLMLASEGAVVTLLDLSPNAVELIERRARAAGTNDRVNAIARDASDLSCFNDAEFDLVYASAALHHTLKYRGAMNELVRVIKPGGVLIMAETLGNNPALNAVRRLRAKLAGEVEDAGEEIILGRSEIALLHQHFQDVEVHPLNLLAMGKRLFRGRFASAPVRGAIRVLEAADQVLLGIVPPLRTWCGEALITARR